jgi:hypothetical protein
LLPCCASAADDAVGCVAVPKDCGLKAGSLCCPYKYNVATNPRMGRAPCPKKHYCAYARFEFPEFPGSELLSRRSPGPVPTGTCMANPPDCGRRGKPCCIIDMLSTTHIVCNPGGGARGYCADKSGQTRGAGARLQDLICNVCPDKADDVQRLGLLKASQPEIYQACKY